MKLEKRQASLPRLLLDKIGVDAELAQDKACKPRLRAKRIRMQDGHERVRRETGGENKAAFP